MKLTLEQIEEIERRAVLIYEDDGMHVGVGNLEALCQLARERLTQGTFAEGIEAAAKLVEENAVIESADGNSLRKRYDGDIHSLHYATAIRNLKPEVENG